MIFHWQSARMAWILLIGVGVGALYLNDRVRSLEEDLQDAQQWRDAAVVRTRRLEAELTRITRLAGVSQVVFANGWLREPMAR